QPLYRWSSAAVIASPAEVARRHLEWAHRSTRSEEPVTVDLRNVYRTRNACAAQLPSAGGAIPLVAHRQGLGALACGGEAERQAYDLVANAQLLAEVLAGALARKRSEHALTQSEVMKSAILQSLTSGVAVIDRDGTLLQVNPMWNLLGRTARWMDLRSGDN